LLTLVLAIFARGHASARSILSCHFLVTPFDCGTSVLKSDKYLQLAESAQLDYLVKTRLAGTLLRRGIRVVNLSQFVRFQRPIRVFDRVRVETSVIHADAKCIHFSHSLYRRDEKCAEVFVKMKLKLGLLTVPPREVFGDLPYAQPAQIKAQDEALQAMRLSDVA
jgi:hypothetical protein